MKSGREVSPVEGIGWLTKLRPRTRTLTSVSSDVPRDKVSYTAMGLLTHLFRGTSELKIWWAHTNFRGFRDVLTKYFRTHISRFCYFPTLQRDIEKSGFDVFFALES